MISVADNGLGFDMRHSENIFRIFQRLYRQDEIPGSGVGLAVCKKIAERHGGQISVKSAPGRGSTFYVALRASEPVQSALSGA